MGFMGYQFQISRPTFITDLKVSTSYISYHGVTLLNLSASDHLVCKV